jgi:TPR repeat protein
MRLDCNEGHAHVIYSRGTNERKAFLHRAAQDGHAPAMYQYAHLCTAPRQRLRWLRRAAEAGYLPAMGDLECSASVRPVAQELPDFTAPMGR